VNDVAGVDGSGLPGAGDADRAPVTGGWILDLEEQGVGWSEEMHATERERARIAADIHDDTIQALNALQLRLERGRLSVSDPTAREILDRTGEQVRDATARLRHLMFGLMPPVPEQRLRQAVETYCELLFEDAPTGYEVCGDPADIPGDTYLLAYRLIQEALRNALKHASASRVRTELELGRGELTARISDDGVGFGSHGPPATHAGLRLVRQRARAAGGSATTTDVGLDERGSTILIRLPLPNAGGT
jgi:signal transduction histidine kinase